jgi:uncharacterized membrane protein
VPEESQFQPVPPQPAASQPAPAQPAQSGLSDNNAGALAYVTIIPAIIFLVAAPYNTNPYIKFHAWQNIFLCIAWIAISVIGVIPILGWLIFVVGSIALVIVWVLCLVNALQGKKFKVPFIGDLAEKQAGA